MGAFFGSLPSFLARSMFAHEHAQQVKGSKIMHLIGVQVQGFEQLEEELNLNTNSNKAY